MEVDIEKLNGLKRQIRIERPFLGTQPLYVAKWVKGCICYILASLFFKCKREHLETSKKVHITKEKNNICKKCNLKTTFRPFFVCKELSTTSVGKLNF